MFESRGDSSAAHMQNDTAQQERTVVTMTNKVQKTCEKTVIERNKIDDICNFYSQLSK